MAWDLADYEEVKDRLPRFWARHEFGAIETEIVFHAPGEYIVKATLWNNARQVLATGLAREQETQKGVNATSALENCETSAIGRALANAGFSSGKNRPSREEMAKADRGGGGAARAQASGDEPPPPSSPATKPQRAKIQHLVNQTGAVPKTWPLSDDLTKAQASEIIDFLNTFPIEAPAERVGTLRKDAAGAAAEFVGTGDALPAAGDESVVPDSSADSPVPSDLLEFDDGPM